MPTCQQPGEFLKPTLIMSEIRVSIYMFVKCNFNAIDEDLKHEQIIRCHLLEEDFSWSFVLYNNRSIQKINSYRSILEKDEGEARREWGRREGSQLLD